MFSSFLELAVSTNPDGQYLGILEGWGRPDMKSMFAGGPKQSSIWIVLDKKWMSRMVES